MQSEIVQDGSNKVGFFGKCLTHAISSGIESEDVMKEDVYPSSGGSCARTEVLHLSFFSLLLLPYGMLGLCFILWRFRRCSLW